jgi:hypothetical protein
MSEYIVICDDMIKGYAYLKKSTWSSHNKKDAHRFSSKKEAIDFMTKYWSSSAITGYNIRVILADNEDTFIDSSEGPIFEEEIELKMKKDIGDCRE